MHSGGQQEGPPKYATGWPDPTDWHRHTYQKPPLAMTLTLLTVGISLTYSL